MGLLPTDQKDQQKLLAGLLPLLLLVGYWWFMHQGKAEEIAAMETRLEELDRNNATARAIANQGAGEQLARRLELYEEHMQRLEQLIPDGDEVAELLNMIATRAEVSGVQLALMRPDEDVAGDFYLRKTFDIGVIGDYHDIGQFLAEVGSLPRIVTPIDLTLSRREDQGTTLEAGFRIVTYVLPPLAADTTGGVDG